MLSELFNALTRFVHTLDRIGSLVEKILTEELKNQ